jgi:hypothetical protein
METEAVSTFRSLFAQEVFNTILIMCWKQYKSIKVQMLQETQISILRSILSKYLKG